MSKLVAMIWALAIAPTVVMTVCAVTMVSCSQPASAKQLHNGYWPFSVETVVRDR